MTEEIVFYHNPQSRLKGDKAFEDSVARFSARPAARRLPAG